MPTSTATAPLAKASFMFIADPGHGWVGVPVCYWVAWGRPALSRYSYFDRRSQTIWAEEDCDAQKVADAAKAHGYDINLIEHHIDTDSPIRRLPRFADCLHLLGA